MATICKPQENIGRGTDMAKVIADRGETVYTLVLSEQEALDLTAWVAVHNPTNTGLALSNIYSSLVNALRAQGHARSEWTDNGFSVNITSYPF